MILGFSGSDYSGKSTQIGMVQSRFGFIVIWSRFGYTPFILYLKSLLRKVISTAYTERRENFGDQTSKANKPFFDLWST